MLLLGQVLEDVLEGHGLASTLGGLLLGSAIPSTISATVVSARPVIAAGTVIASRSVATTVAVIPTRAILAALSLRFTRSFLTLEGTDQAKSQLALPVDLLEHH
ncbi:MAG TPA: hypothetical protein VFZ06_02195, partial [Acidimicrobiia bacterium]|nr:hypothetical protein [Acidimicrobiia bacterium]